MNITIEPWRGETGRKSILVDGVRWGSIHMTRHGVHGNSYRFQQAGSTYQIERAVPVLTPGRPQRYAVVTVKGDKLARRAARIGDLPISYIDDRLLTAVRELIAEGLLTSETAYRAKVEQRQAEFREREVAAAREKEQMLRNEACCRLEGMLGKAPNAAILDVVVNLMEWAQSR